jgi:predicted metal-dependent peptidase
MGISDIKKAADKVVRAICDLQKTQPFFAHLLMHMRPQVMPVENPQQSMGVDAKGGLYYNEEWVMGLSDAEAQGVLCHEVLHVGLKHCVPEVVRVHEIVNIAQDIVVNMTVLASGMQIPKQFISYDIYRNSVWLSLDGVSIRIEKVSEKFWEQVYDEIMQYMKNAGKDVSKYGQMIGRGPFGFDDHMIGGELSEAELQEAAKQWSQNLVDAATYAQQKGNLPRGMNRIIDALLKPRVNWKQYLLKYLRPYLQPVDWSYHKPHRKSQVLGVFLPTVLKEHCDVEVLVDTSGSVSQRTLTEFVTEIVSIARSMSHVKIGISFCDTRIHAHYVVENADIPKILAATPKGGGGTSLESSLDELQIMNREVPIVVALTDGHDTYQKTRRDYPFDVIWCIAPSPNGVDIQSWSNGPKYGLRIKMEV